MARSKIYEPTKKEQRAGKDACVWCGKWCAPGPMLQHLKVCAKNPNRPERYSVQQPTGICPGCGLVTTLGALTTHMRYGCAQRTEDGDARQTCQYCGDVTTLGGALASHEKACPQNPALPKPIPLDL